MKLFGSIEVMMFTATTPWTLRITKDLEPFGSKRPELV